MSDQVKILKDATENWLKVANAPALDNELYIMTPYFTGSIISNLVKSAGQKEIHFITELASNSILFGSVDLEIVENLLEQGVYVYSRSNLHAKLIYNGYSAVIGSQNFTRKGQSNLEVSVFLDDTIIDHQLLTLVIKEARQWATLITQDHIKEMKKWRDECSEDFADLLKRMKELDSLVDSRSNQNRIENHQIDLPQSTASLITQIKNIKFAYAKKGFRLKESRRSSYQTLKPVDKKDNFASFFERSNLMTGSSNLDRFKNDGKQLLLFNSDSMETIYAEVRKTQISKFVSAFDSGYSAGWHGTGGYISVPGEFEDEEIDFRVYCRSPLSNNSFSNFALYFYELDEEREGSYKGTLSIYLLFDGRNLKIQKEEILVENPILKRREENKIRLVKKYLNTQVLGAIFSPAFGFSMEFSDYEQRLYPKDFFNPMKKYEMSAVKSSYQVNDRNKTDGNNEMFYLSVKSM